MATYTWSQYTFLTAQQQAGLQSFFDLGKQLQAMGKSVTDPKPGVEPIPTITHSNAKRAGEILRDLKALEGPTEMGVRYTLNYWRAVDQKEFEEANP